MISISPKHPVTVGSFNTWTIKYRVGKNGIDVGGAIRVAIDEKGGCGIPQCLYPQDANYIKCFSSAEAHLSLNTTERRRSVTYIPLAACDLYFVEVLVSGKPLKKGDIVYIIFGDTSKGGKGFQAPVKNCKEFKFWMFIDGKGEYKFRNLQPEKPFFKELISEDGKNLSAPLPDSPGIEIIPDTVRELVLRVPSVVEVSEKFNVHLVGEDKYHNPVSDVKKALKFSCPSAKSLPSSFIFRKSDGGNRLFSKKGSLGIAGAHRITVTDKRKNFLARSNPIKCVKGSPQYRIYWGDIHGHGGLSDGGVGTPDEYYTYARDIARLDFCALTEHGFGCAVKGHWAKIKNAVKKYYYPGRFVTFLAWECMPGRGKNSGHKNIYYLDDDGPFYYCDWQRGSGGGENWDKIRCYRRVAENQIKFCRDIEEVWRKLPKRKALTIAHHIFNWDYHDTHSQRLVEVCSEWGISETGIRQNRSARTFQEALERGYNLGFVGGSDNHQNRPGGRAHNIIKNNPVRYKSGLTAVYARDLTRESIWEALWNRRVYATTGERIIVEFTMDGHMMGEEYAAFNPPKLAVTVCGTEPIDRIEVFRNKDCIYTYYGDKTEENFLYVDEKIASGKSYYYARVIQADCEIAWSSPIWITYGKR